MAYGQWRGAVNVSLGCLVVCVLTLAVSATSAQAASRCVVHGHSVVGVRTSKLVELAGNVVVYRTRPRSEEYGPMYNDVWACGRKSNRFVLIAVEELNEEYGTEGALSGFHVSGNWLIVAREAGQVEIDECEKYQQADSQDCPAGSESLLVVNTANGLEGSISSAILPPGPAMLSDEGAIAWWSQTQESGKEAVSSLYGCATATTGHKLVCKPRLVAKGSIPAASVHLLGTTLNWTAAEQQQSSVL
jgi:hypothetical protein